jgi:hypothetical protein
MLPLLLLLLAPQLPVREASREDILAAMRASQGFAVTATANGPRLQAEVVLRMLRETGACRPEGLPLFLGHAAWYESLLELAGLQPAQAPLYARLAFENRQDMEIDCREGTVIEQVAAGGTPRLAGNVTISWAATPGSRSSFSYEDLLATPQLKVSMDRVITYRLVDFGDLVLYDEVEGLHGRPTSGVLGALFAMIGEAAVVENRMTLAPDGTQVTWARGRKAFLSVAATATIDRAGRAEKGVPEGRADLAALATRIGRPLEVKYRPFPRPRRAAFR